MPGITLDTGLLGLLVSFNTVVAIQRNWNANPLGLSNRPRRASVHDVTHLFRIEK